MVGERGMEGVELTDCVRGGAGITAFRGRLLRRSAHYERVLIVHLKPMSRVPCRIDVIGRE